MKNDRIHKAWVLRNSIHQFLIANPHSNIVEIFAAFPEHYPETVRKAVIRLRKDGDACMVGRRGTVGIFTAVTKSIKPEEDKRKALANGARRTHSMIAKEDKFDRAYKTRKTILAFAKGKPSITTNQVHAYLKMVGISITVDGCCRIMTGMSVEGSLEKWGKGKQITFCSTGIPTTTADEMRQNMLHKRGITNEIRKKKESGNRIVGMWHGGRYLNIKTDEPAMKSQGGQGALRRKIGIQASAGML